jgi:hypothetical protein
MLKRVAHIYQGKICFRFKLSMVNSFRIRKFLGLPDPLFRGRNRNQPDPPIIKQNGKKILDFYCFVTSFDILFEE